MRRLPIKDVATEWETSRHRNCVHGLKPVYTGIYGSWRVACAAIIANRTPRGRVPFVMETFFASMNCPTKLVETELQVLVDLLPGVYRRVHRADLLVNMSRHWLKGAWLDMRELPGVGLYTADCVGLFCFGDTELESGDKELTNYVRTQQANMVFGCGTAGTAQVARYAQGSMAATANSA